MNEVKAMIRELVLDEDARKPLSDQRIADELQSRRIEIRRRTVAKYREEMGIPSTRLRGSIC